MSRAAHLEHTPVAKTGMLIRKPVAEVFEAFIASTQVTAKVIEPNERILVEWDGYSGRTNVEWKFKAQDDGATFVSITESGWTGSGDELVEYATNSTQGFTWTLAGLKALLEHNLRLNLVADRYPNGPGDPYPGE